jgi:archaellum component FlaC
MTQEAPSADRIRSLRRRLHELDDVLRARREELRRLRDDIRRMQRERQVVARELASFRVALTSDVMSQLAQGRTIREIARAVKQSPAVVSRVIEQARSAARRKKIEG